MADQDFISGALSGQQFQLNKFLIQEAPVKLEQEKLALKISETDFQARQKMAQLLAKNSSQIPEGQNPLTNASNSLIEMATAAVASGLPEEAAKDFGLASKIMSEQEDAAYKQWQVVDQKAKFATQILAGVTDQKSLDQANAYIRMSTGTKSALDGQKYSPELIEELHKAMTTKRSDAQNALDRSRAAKTAAETKSEAERPALIKSQTELNQARAKAADKHGGDGLMAKRSTVAATAKFIAASSGDSISLADASALSEDIALDVEKRMSQNHQTLEQAISASVRSSKRHGMLSALEKPHVRPGTDPSKPLPMPKTKAELVDGKYYPVDGISQHYDKETDAFYPEGEGPDDEEAAE
jgi:hypothetical protein